MPPMPRRGGGRGRSRGRRGGSQYSQHNSEKKEKHPSHLKGREIGMFYAARSAARAPETRKRPLGTIILSPNKKEQIQTMLNSNTYRGLFQITSNTYNHVEDSVFKRNFLKVITGTLEEKLENCIATNLIQPQDATDLTLLENHLKKQTNEKYKAMFKQRMQLPSYSKRTEILELINHNQVVVISGETGCGKTTQVAQFILDDYIEKKRGSTCRIICTQPRRISAIAVAERVADERAEQLGNSVGYQIRLENRSPRERGSMKFCTTGVVLKLMETDPALSHYSHLILDEIHERDVMSDFILALVKRLILKRKDLKIILMSATLNSDKFSKYYNDAPHMNIPGFTFPVQEFYLEDVIERTNFEFPNNNIRRKDPKIWHGGAANQREFSDFIEPHVRLLESVKQYSRNTCIQLRNPESEKLNCDLIVALIKDICRREKDPGAILVFVTGFTEIAKIIQLMEESSDFPSHKYKMYPLHSMMPTTDQKLIFLPPPEGVRKIVVATNIAETSITINDVVYVIDCGKIKMSNFEVRTNSKTLDAQWVSLANASQRRGRAGRVKPGKCFHLYSKARELILEQYPKPEILRTRLEDTILTTKLLQLGKVEPFFTELIDAPDPEVVALALNLLKRLDALTDDEVLTPLGYHLARLPMQPQMGKMILFGAIFSCLDPILSIAATLDFKDPFQLVLGKEDVVIERKTELAAGIRSDHLLYYEAIKRFEADPNDRGFCWRYFLSYNTLKLLLNMKKQFMEYLYDMNFVGSTNPKAMECNRNSGNISLIKAIVCAGLYPNIGIAKGPGKPPLFSPDFKQKMELHPKSILSQRYNGKFSYDSNILVYYEKVKSTSTFIYDASLVHSLPVIFFGDHFTQTYEEGYNLIIISDRLRFKCSESTSAIIKELRDRFNWFLEYKISHPGPIVWGDENNDAIRVLEIIMELITCEDTDAFEAEAYLDY